MWVLLLKSVLLPPSGPVLQPSDVFEQPVPAGQRKIEFHISVPDVAAAAEESGRGLQDDEGGGTFTYFLPAILNHPQLKCFLFCFVFILESFFFTQRQEMSFPESRFTIVCEKRGFFYYYYSKLLLLFSFVLHKTIN